MKQKLKNWTNAMIHYSPLRYPGGKNRLSRLIAELCKANKIDGHYIEPYAGGASVALYLLINGYIKEITINDYDISIYAFWYSVLNNTEKLCSMIRAIDISVENWKQQRDIQRNKSSENDLLKLGFSTLFMNRTNYSGIIKGGTIGGIHQTGKYRIDCRFNKKALIDRIKFVAIHSNKINLKRLDAMELISLIQMDNNMLIYFDPPYYEKGPLLYMNSYRHEDHIAVSEKIKGIERAKWLVSYDNTAVISELYSSFRRIEYSFYHTAYRARVGNEVIYISKGTRVPEECVQFLTRARQLGFNGVQNETEIGVYPKPEPIPCV